MVKDKRQSALQVTCGAHVLHDGLVDMLYALLPLLRDAFGLSFAQVGLLRAVHKTATAAFQIPVGIWSEHAGTRPLLVAGTVLAGFGFLGLSAANNFGTIITFIFLAGCGGAFQHPLSSAILSKSYSKKGQRSALGTYNAFGDIGKFLFLGITILSTASLNYSWQAPVYWFGAIALITAAYIWFFLKKAAIGDRPKTLPAKTKKRATAWGVKHTRGFVILGVITALDNTTRNGFLTFAAFLMIEKGVSTEWSALAVLVTVFGGMCGKMAVGIIAERIGVTRTIAFTEFATAGMIVVIIVLPSLYAFFLLPFLGVFLNGTSSAIYGTVPDLIKGEKHSRAYGLIYTLGSVCGIIAPLGYGVLADWTGIEKTMVVVAGVVLLTIPLCKTLEKAINEAKQT